DDLDSQFIFLWISFNAAYAQDLDFSVRGSETNSFSRFIEKLVELDDDKALYNLIWQEFTSSIRLLLGNHFVYQPFWDHVSGKLSEGEWKNSFENANSAANRAFAKYYVLPLVSGSRNSILQ
ncbi:MAG: hypothetical protein CMK92_06660, partial [Pseudomonas sp.]|nr:hypothetical protein [Pseudomonas sp.]